MVHNISIISNIFIFSASNILRNLMVGDIVAVKCTDKFYRGKVIDIFENSCFSLYLIDSGYVLSASIDCIVDLPDTLKKVWTN